MFSSLKYEAARLFNTSVDNIACGSSCTELLNSIAWAMLPKSHNNIVSTESAFPSTVYPWTRVAMVNNAEVRLAKYDDN